MSTSLSRLSRFAAVAAIAALSLTACTLEKQSAPSLSGPSGVGLSLSLAATPQVLPRDGASASTISIATVDSQGRAVQERVLLSTTAGTLSATDVTTDASGHATVRFTAPSVNQGATSSVITAQPVDSTNASTVVSLSRTVTIDLTGPGVPVPSFTFSPSSPGQLDLVTFDASATTLSGSTCGSTCTYSWDFGDGSSSTGQVVSHRFASQGSSVVTLTVTAPGGTSATKSTTVSVGSPSSLTATIAFSPTDPGISETVSFDGSGSKTPDGTSISSYAWDFGCAVGENCTVATASGVTATTKFTKANTFTVRLTITDSVGRTATTTTTVTVK